MNGVTANPADHPYTLDPTPTLPPEVLGAAAIGIRHFVETDRPHAAVNLFRNHGGLIQPGTCGGFVVQLAGREGDGETYAAALAKWAEKARPAAPPASAARDHVLIGPGGFFFAGSYAECRERARQIGRYDSVVMPNSGWRIVSRRADGRPDDPYNGQRPLPDPYGEGRA